MHLWSVREQLDTPTPWLLLDAMGALASAVMHGVVLRRVLPVTGMPAEVLGALAVIACGLAVFSIVSWNLSTRSLIGVARAGQLLRTVALANVLFCLGLAALLVVFSEVLTGWGYAYFALEIAAVLWLANVEWRVGVRSLRRVSERV